MSDEHIIHNSDGGTVVTGPVIPVAECDVVESPDGRGGFIVVKDGYQVEQFDGKKEGVASHVFDDVSSLCAYMNDRLDPDDIDVDILVENSAVVVIVDPSHPESQRIECRFVKHPAFEAWESVFNETLNQKRMHAFVRSWRDTISDSTGLMGTLAAMSVTTASSLSQHIDETGATRLSSAEGKADVSVKVPSSLAVTVPCYDGVLEASTSELCVYGLDVLVSMELEPSPVFDLSCPTLKLTKRQARHDVAAQLRRELNAGFLVGLGEALRGDRVVRKD